MSVRPHRLCTLLLPLACLAAVPAPAETRVSARGALDLGPQAGEGFNLHVERRDIDVVYDDGTGGDRLEVGRIGIGWSETLLPGLHLGIEGGRQELQQNGRSATAGRELTGYYGALTADTAWPLAEAAWLEVGARLAYSEVDDGGTTTVDIDWWSASLRPALGLRLGDAVALRAGVRAYWLDGDERVSDAGGGTTGLGEADVGGAFVGLDVYTGNGGRVGVRADGGAVRALRVVFERRY